MPRRFAGPLLAAAVLFSITPAFAESDVSKFTINGLRLGMTVGEVREKMPDLALEEARLADGRVVGLMAFPDRLVLRFAGDEKGEQRLFHILRYRVFKGSPDPYPLFMALVKKYGYPDYTGRDMWRIKACWGKCYGEHKKLEFTLKIAGIKDGFPMNVGLIDPAMEETEWAFVNWDPLARKHGGRTSVD